MGKAPASRLRVAAANALLNLAFAPACASCGEALVAPLDGCVCRRCWTTVTPPPHVGWPDPLSAVGAAADYAGTFRQIVHAFKYDGRRSLAGPIAELMVAHGGDVLQDAAYAVPVPLHPLRRMRRGFNQATDLAVRLRVPVLPILWRVRATATQAHLTAAERRHNVRGAFTLSPLASRRSRRLLHDAVVVLVDDVRTTGSTLQACAEVLCQAGAREVRALTAAVRGIDV